MAWGVLDTEWRRHANERPHLKLPLPHALLSDPAFSSDPRSHPHFAAQLSSRPPALSSHPPSPPPPPAVTQPKLAPDPPEAPTPARGPPRRVPPHNSNVLRKGSMKALVRRLTSHYNLDRIDELDETDPFGVSYHHDGPYEAIGNHAHPAIPRIHDGPAPWRADTHHSKPELGSRSLHPPQYHSPPSVPYAHGEKGLSLHLEPGQILQHNVIYTSHAPNTTSVPARFRRQSTAFAIVTRPDHSRSHSLPNPLTYSPGDSIDRPSSFPRAPLQYHLGDRTQGISDIPPYHHDRDPAPYTTNQTEIIALPPPQHESRLHISGPAPSSFKHTSQRTRSTEAAVPALPRRDPRHKSAHPSETPYVTDSATARSLSSVQKRPTEPPRARHLPRRLVMPAPLQPHPAQIQYGFPPAGPVAWRDEYQVVEGVKFEEYGTTDAHGSRPPHKKLSTLKPSLLHHESDAAVPTTMGSTLMGDADEAKEKTRRRRLSKRRNDV